MLKRGLLAAVMVGVASGCTWVKMEDQALTVSLVTLDRVQQCQRLGTTQSTTKQKVGLFKRSENKVAEELLALAKNSAIKMGGDTVVPEGPMLNGSQTFVVYRCGAEVTRDTPPMLGIEVEKAI